MQNKMFNDFRKHRNGINDKTFASVLMSLRKFFALDKEAYLEQSTPNKNNEMIGFDALIVLRNMDELV